MNRQHVTDGSPCWCAKQRLTTRYPVPHGGWRCPDPTCSVRDTDPESLLQHAVQAHWPDRRRQRREKVA